MESEHTNETDFNYGYSSRVQPATVIILFLEKLQSKERCFMYYFVRDMSIGKDNGMGGLTYCNSSGPS